MRPYKPIDVGNGIVAGTITPDGRWLSLGIAHPVHGRVVLTTAEPFPDELRYDAQAVRAYRARLAAPDRAGAGIGLDAAVSEIVVGGIARSARSEAEILTFAPLGHPGAVQVVRGVRDIAWTGELRLDRAAYPQLTEGGPLPPLQTSPERGEDGLVRWIRDASLGAAAAIARTGTAVGVALGTELGEVIAEALALAADAALLLERELELRRAGPTDPRMQRAYRWLLDCAVCEVAPGRAAILADPEILPLVWTRDAYYVARALLAVAPDDERARVAVGAYLNWQFETARRVEGWWPRSSLASGQAKDPAFQLDQQLWPLLLLAEHRAITDDTTLFDRYAAVARGQIDALLARAGVPGGGSEDGLIATRETPADDPLELPYHFSSHVLLWRVLALYEPPLAERLHATILERFTHDGRFAYAIDGSGRASHYHDANDVPTALAPAWGFCAADDAVWRATVEFAWSERNAAFFAGPLGGLGSRHTRHPWPLGDLQRVIVARAIGDAALERAAWERLDRVATHDGLLPEAYDERDGSVASRHWFAWPVALRAWLEAERA